jgi:selenoprotein W-related protein
LHESAELIKSSGGVFEVEDHGKLIFSKKELGRFPENGEVFSIAKALDAGTPLEEAKLVAGASATKPISFVNWVKWKMTGNRNS